MSYYVIIRGPLGCGKTTIAKELCSLIDAEYFSIDAALLLEHGLENDREDGYISQKSFKRANQLIVPKAKKVLAKDKPIVFDGNFYWESALEDLIQRLKYPHFVFTLQAPVELCIERDQGREKPHGKDAVFVVHKKTSEFDYGTVVDVDRPLEDCINDIHFHLR